MTTVSDVDAFFYAGAMLLAPSEGLRNILQQCTQVRHRGCALLTRDWISCVMLYGKTEWLTALPHAARRHNRRQGQAPCVSI